MITTEVANFKSLSPEDFDCLYNIMLHAYASTEVEVWGENYVRMSRSEFSGLIEKGQLIIARYNATIAGSIQVSELNATSAGFGLLSADFDLKGKGIGRTLILAAENFAKQGSYEYMELEILRPLHTEVETKTNLKNWYERLGYSYIETISFENRKPDKANKARNFVQPCVFDCYRKKL